MTPNGRFSRGDCSRLVRDYSGIHPHLTLAADILCRAHQYVNCLLLSHLSVGALRLYVEETLMDTPSDGIPLGDVAPNLPETAHLTLAFLN